jgi:hypothetical protein
MDEKLQQIIATMVANGESHGTITSVIERYKSKNTDSDVVENTQVVAKETAPAMGETPAVEDTELVSEDISLDGPIDKPQASIMVGGSRVYLNEVIQSLQDQDDRPLEVQTKEYKDKVINIAKNPNLSKEEKDEQISTVLKPSYLILESGTGDEAVYVPRPEVKKRMANNMPENIKEFETKEDLTRAINESIGKTIRDDEGIKALVEIQQFNKKNILEEKALEIQSKADLTTPEGVAKAKKEFNDFYTAEVYGEVQKSPAFNKIVRDLEVVGADVAGDLNKQWGRYNDEFLRGIDESSFWSPGGVKEMAYKGIKSFKSAINKTMLSGEQLALQKSDEELKDLESKIKDKSIGLDDEISVRKQEVGMSGRPTFTVEKVKVKDRLEELKSKKENLTENIVEGLDKIKATDDYLALFTESPDPEGFGFEYALNAAKAAPSIIAEQAPQLIVGGLSVFGGPITAGIATAAMFTPMYAENYWGALTDGLRDELGREPEQEDYIKALEEGKYASQANSAAFAAVQTAAERFGAKKVLSSTFSKIGKNTINGVGSLYKGEIKKFAKNALAKGLDMTESAFTERLTESAQSFLNQVSVGTQTGGVTDMFKYIDIDQINKEGEMGMIAGFFMPFAGNVTRQSLVELKNSARDVATKFDLTSNIERAQADRFFTAAQENIDNKFKNGEITVEEKQIEVEALANTRNAGLKIPKNFSTSAKQKSFDLILERQNLQDQVNREDEAFTVPAKERIKEINTELGNIQSVEIATRAAVKAVEKADIDLNVIELDTEADVESYLKENMNMTASKAKEAGKQRGFIMPDGKTIIINKDVASKEGAVTTAAHEILHGVLFNTLNKGDESAFALANAIKMQLSNISTEDFKNSDLAARIEQYKADPDINEATKAEEVLTLFSEALATGDIKFNENVFTKIKDFVRRILQNAGFSNIDFNDSKDVYNFIKDYNKSVAKGKFTKAQVKAAKEGVAVGRRLKERVEDVAEKGVDETILKFSKQASDNVQKIYEEQGVGGALDIIEEFKPIVNKIVQRRSEAPNFDRELLTSEIEIGLISKEPSPETGEYKQRSILGLIREYGPYVEKQKAAGKAVAPLAGFINKQLPKRMIEASQKILGESFTEDVSERVDIAAPEVEVEIKTKEEKVPRSLRKKLNVEKGSDLYNKVKDAVVKTFGTKLPEVTDTKFKKALSDSYKRELKKEVNALMGTRSDFKMFVTNNAETLYKSIPQETINKRFQDFAEPVLDKEGKQVREKTAVGKGVFKKKPFNKEEFINYFLGEDVGASTKGTRKTALSETIADEMALDATMEVIEDPKVFEKFKEIQEIEGKEVPKDIKPKISEKVKRPEGFKFSFTSKQKSKIEKAKKQFDQGEELQTDNWNKIVEAYGFESINMNSLEGKNIAKKILFEGVDGKKPIIRNLPKSFIINNKGTFSNGGMYETVRDVNSKRIPLTKKELKFLSDNGFKPNQHENLKRFKLKNGNTVLNNSKEFVTKEIQLQILPGARNNSNNAFMFANSLQIDEAIKEAEKIAAKEGVPAFAPENLNIDKSLKRTSYSRIIKKGFDKLFLNSEKQKTKGFKKILSTLNNLIQEDPNYYLPTIAAILSSTSGSQGHFIRKGSVVSFLNKLKLLKTVEEHLSPASSFAKFVFDRMVQGDFNKYIENSLNVYKQGLLPLVYDKMLKGVGPDGNAFNYIKNIPKKYKLDVLLGKIPVWVRYFNPDVNSQIRVDENGVKRKGIDPNVIILENGNSIAKEYGLDVDFKLLNSNVIALQQKLLFEIFTNPNMTKAKARAELDQYLKIAPSQLKASKSTNKTLNNSKVLDVEDNLNIQDLLSKAASIDKALKVARDPNAPIKKIRVFDFDDTLATTKSDVLFTAPDGTEGKLNAEEFAKQGAQLLEEGYVFDFSEFNKVTKGKPGPLLEVAKKIQAARGTEDVFVLTARAPEAQVAIKEFLDSVGLNIPLENITGLGNSTGEAKANWMIDKAAEGYNDFYFADDAYQNVKAVRDAMSVLDVKSKVQQAKINFSKSVNEDFNKIIEQTTGIASEKVYSEAKAKVRGANKGNKKFFIPYSAEDFMGLIYPLLSKGKLGDSQMAWFKKNLLDPYARAQENLSTDRLQLMGDFKTLKKALEVPKDLRKKTDSGFTKEQAVRVYLFNKAGFDVPGISKTDLNELLDLVNSDGVLKAFGDQIFNITKGDGYAKPGENWLVGTITTDLIDVLNTVKRAKYLEQSGYTANAELIFSKENLNKLEAAYGTKYREAMENTLGRMKSGKNRIFSGNRLSNRVLDYINNSTGAIMFFNTRSAVLQTISAINFLNWSFNNPIKAGAAFANQPQYWKDFVELINSDYLVDRRNGLKLNINESEIADAAATSKNKAKAAINYILQKGFLPTQFADSFAIAAGGATFYRNRINDLIKNEEMSEVEAKKQAMLEWRETAEISQQSSDPSKISAQQASDLGRVILAFANTPMQYARIQKRALQDLVKGRGDAKTHVSKIIYYAVVQNLIFNALQSALFGLGFGDDEDDEKKEKMYLRTANGMLDSQLRGLGLAGATVAVIKNFLTDIYERSGRSRPEYVDSIYKLLQISPPISSKISKIRGAAWQFDSKKRRQEMFDKGFSIDNPAYEASAKVISATANIPLDRVYSKVNNISGAMDEDSETWQTVAMLAGWPKWQIMPDSKESSTFSRGNVKVKRKTLKKRTLKR